MEKTKTGLLEANKRYISFLRLLKNLDLYQVSFELEDTYWEFLEVLRGERDRE